MRPTEDVHSKSKKKGATFTVTATLWACRSCERTVDKLQAEPGQLVCVQILIDVKSVASLLNPPPALHSSDENQVVTVAGAAQSLFRLKTWFLSNFNLLLFSRAHTSQTGFVAFYLDDLCSVQQVVVKRVSGQGSGNRHHGQSTPE